MTVPNVRCPKCGKPTFFFAASNGGRVFFDELGPPWPKHPCMISDVPSLPGFQDEWAVVRWQRSRRELHGPDASDEVLPFRPGSVSASAVIIRRRTAWIAVVETDDGRRALEVEDGWPGREARTVYYVAPEAGGVPSEIQFLTEELGITSLRVMRETTVPPGMTPRDFAAVAETAMPEVREWIRTDLTGFRAGPQIRLDGHTVGVAGWLGRSRVIVAPLAPWFDGDDDLWSVDDYDYEKASELQIRNWTGRFLKILDQSPRMRRHPLYRDVLLWVAPAGTWTFFLQQRLNELTRGPTRYRNASEVAADQTRLPGLHIAQAMEDVLEETIRETAHSFDYLANAERAHLAKEALTSREKRWLEAMVRDAGLAELLARFVREGVRLDFLGTVAATPDRWGQQAVLPDGRRLLVLLHRSTPELGLAFVSFGEPIEDDYGDVTFEANAMFHARSLVEVLRALERPSPGAANLERGVQT